MTPALVAQSRTRAPFRFGVVYMPCGVYPDTWHPDQTGADFVFKPVMQPVEPFRNQLVTISKMKAPWGESVHVGASSAFLNGIGPVVERESTGDHRLSLAERSATKEIYVAAVKNAAANLVHQRFLLKHDADALIAQAEQAGIRAAP